MLDASRLVFSPAIFLCAAIAVCGTSAMASDLTVSRAEIAGGRLVVAGTAQPGQRLRLEGRSAADFNAIADRAGAFGFSVAYVPSDCVVSIQAVAASFAPGPATDVALAGCAHGPTPRGAWSKAASYAANDLVSYEGSSWLATRDNASRPPLAGPDWQLFAQGEIASAGAETDAKQDSAGPGTDRVPPDGPAGGDLTGTYPNPQIRAGTIVGADIALGTIGNGRLAANSVSTDKIVDGQVRSADLADAGVTSAKLAAGAVVAGKIAADSIGTAEVAPGSLFGSDIFDGSITSADLGTSSVSSAEIANGSVTGDDIASHTIGQGDIDGTDHYGSVGVGGLSNGRCTTVAVNTGGSQAGDAGILTTDGDLPDGEVFYLQRVRDGTVDIKVCNLSGGSLPAVTTNVRILTFH